ncbi:CBS domain-containing protein [Sphaerobacter thermophilus]|uniref:CBS domain containing membrane protein n=1 Tax=Sphaerobacter thermophilus (strain ATCC 49802 / DSM 20745 / KCCM 41009 / NCIMB 13125 / S 6022) TaxID=479434 RepID=D1C308_SPHTD|nr:CBS domain-containing protein [Sphaerobacter thermophilus]ACZ38625.1 CBS domain containing membrane protein [Sphaerobacter thermophilus DSM 20745]PZN67932.1 MAG: CBS domain-containing protein [Sphaerobacter thermophilus]
MTIDRSIQEIMTRDVVAVTVATPVSDVARLLWKHKLTGVPVLEGRRVVGVVTEYDLIARQSEWDAPLYVVFLDAFLRVPGTGDEEQLRRILATTAGQLMSAPAITLTPDATVQDAATLMYERRVNPVPIVDDAGELVGIVSRSDIVRLMASEESSLRGD